MHSKRLKVAVTLFATIALTLGASHYLLARYPVLQRVKRHVAPLLGMTHRYDVPNAAVAAFLPSLRRPATANRRVTLEDRIAELVIVRTPDMVYVPAGGVILAHNDTRHANTFGRYSS